MRTWEMDPNVIRVEDLEFADYVIVSLTIGNRLEHNTHLI